MQVEGRMQRVLNYIAKNIKAEVDILNLDGLIVASSNKSRIGKQGAFIGHNISVEDRNRFILNGRTYMGFNINVNRSYYLSMKGYSQVIKNYCILIISLIEANLTSGIQTKMNREDIMWSAILGHITDLEFQEAMKDYNIDNELPRCVFIIRTQDMEANEIYKILLNAFPQDADDALILIDSRTLALVKMLEGKVDEEDLIQLGSAIDETILSEASVKSYIGIGSVKNTIYEIRESYIEAMNAIEVGQVYKPNKRVYYYGRLLLERFLNQIPADISEKYCKIFFHEGFKKTLTGEMVTTIEKFFENNLNLSETSRQLYIHRNTLVYRLDKIQNVLGIDLRNFHEAVTFKTMMMLERRNRECSDDRI